MSSMRFVFGPSLGTLSFPAPPADPASPGDPTAPAPKADVLGSLVSYDQTAATLAFPAYDPATAAAPDETRVYLLPVGMPIPRTEDEWVASGASFGSNSTPVPPEGVSAYPVEYPRSLLPAGDYIGQVVFGFNV
jgi:hypothetical protein